MSEDSYRPDTAQPIDPEVMDRALHRRRILEELLSTEEGYIGDIRFLLNASSPPLDRWVMLTIARPTLPSLHPYRPYAQESGRPSMPI